MESESERERLNRRWIFLDASPARHAKENKKVNIRRKTRLDDFFPNVLFPRLFVASQYLTRVNEL